MLGDKLPSVREMSSSLGVNPNTLQRAYGFYDCVSVTGYSSSNFFIN